MIKKEYIKDYLNNDLIHKFKKINGHHTIVILKDKEDDWFYYVITYKTNSGEITDLCMITQRDINTRINSIKNAGYESII